MMRPIFICVIFLLCLSVAFQAGRASRDNASELPAFSIPIKKLFAEPDESSRVVYDVPVNIDLTGMTPDGEWYKVKVSYSFLGYFEYEGWCRVR
jgi:hypothetical protein